MVMDRREYCAKSHYYLHSPESLPDMNAAGRKRQLCLYCGHELTTILLNGAFRWVDWPYIIEEIPW